MTIAGGLTSCTNAAKPAARRQAAAEGVVDGDTIIVRFDAQRERVRLIGIDTPESRRNRKLTRDTRRSGLDRDTLLAVGKRASAFTQAWLGGISVGLESDMRRMDHRRRLLAYVWLPDGALFNLVPLGEGYAQVMTAPPNVKYAELFLACQREAWEQRRELWGCDEREPTGGADFR